MIFAIRQHATRLRFDRVTVTVEATEPTEGGGGGGGGDAAAKVQKVLLEEPTDLQHEAQWTLAPFPDTPKDLDPGTREGIMMHSASSEANAYLEAWVKQLLSSKSICSSIPHIS